MELPQTDEEFYKELLEGDDGLSTADLPLSPDWLPKVQGSLDDLEVPTPLDTKPEKSSNQAGNLTEFTWTEPDEERLNRLAKIHKKNWEVICIHFPGTTAVEVQHHWCHSNQYHAKRNRWKPEEDDLIQELYLKFGGDWKRIATRLEGRAPDTIKTRFYGTIRKRMTPEQRAQLCKLAQQRKVCSLPELLGQSVPAVLVGPAPTAELAHVSLAELPEVVADVETKQRKIRELMHMSAVYQALISRTRQELGTLKRDRESS